MRIIPAIDIMEGRCLRFSQSDYRTSKIYNERPQEVAMQFPNHGITYLHLLDLQFASAEQIVDHRILEEIARNISLKIAFGGGSRSDTDQKIALESTSGTIYH